MSDPYRDSGQSGGAEAPTDRGIVGDVIAQFADPNAFYRELVQNAIDAGSPDVGVDLDYDDSAQRMNVSVRDRGEGMTRDIVENQLLVLFRSTKEKDGSKIGKFGVGFASVLSPNPEVVIVNTVRDGKRLTLHLYRDLTYELFDAGRATHNGTTVTITLTLQAGDVKAFEDASEAALRRWCRHASVPIELECKRGEQKRTVRIDSPLAIDKSHLEVRRVLDGGKLTIVAGIPVDGGQYLGFFNHGLMLHETTQQHDLAKVAVKVQDSRLGHTISRDDVRRDEHYRHALDEARRVVHDDLTTAAAVKLRELAEAGGHPYFTFLAALLDAEIDPGVWHFPLVEPIHGATTITSGDLDGRVLVSRVSTALTKALAEVGRPVVRDSPSSAVSRALQHKDRSAADVDHDLTVVTRVEHTDADTALCKLLHEVFDAVHRAPREVVLVQPVGAREDKIAFALPDSDTRVLDRDDVGKSPFALLGRRALALSVGHPHVASARDSQDPVLAAVHIARAVLLQYSLLDANRSRAVLELALTRIGLSR